MSAIDVDNSYVYVTGTESGFFYLTKIFQFDSSFNIELGQLER